MKNIRVVRITRSTDFSQALLREGDYIIAPSGVMTLLLEHSATWNSNTMGYEESSVSSLSRSKSSHIRYHLFESANLSGFRNYSISKENALRIINQSS